MPHGRMVLPPGTISCLTEPQCHTGYTSLHVDSNAYLNELHIGVTNVYQILKCLTNNK